jgi:hypothetical protein
VAGLGVNVRKSTSRRAGRIGAPGPPWVRRARATTLFDIDK